MAEMTKDINLNQVAILLSRYQFEMRGHNLQDLLEQWIPLYPVRWIRLAVVEALYQGRYKAISVEHILSLWLRRGHPTFHFNHEFERMICNNMLGSTVANPRSAMKRPLTQTALPSFYQMEHSSLNEEIAIASDLTGVEATSEPLPDEALKDELTAAQDDFDFEAFCAEEDSTLLENSNLEPSSTRLTDVKELLAQLMTKSSDLVELTAEPELTNVKAERGTMYGQSIHEFTPHLDHSAVYSKLKASLQQTF
jgi:hypothetical protein